MEDDQEGKQLSSPGEEGSCPLLYLTWTSTNGGQQPLVLHVWRRGEKKGAGEEGEREKGMGEGKKKNRKGKEKKNREKYFSLL